MMQLRQANCRRLSRSQNAHLYICDIAPGLGDQLSDAARIQVRVGSSCEVWKVVPEALATLRLHAIIPGYRRKTMCCAALRCVRRCPKRCSAPVPTREWRLECSP